MSGYMFCLAPRYGCGKPFTFNPDAVPSIKVEGVREPICLDCVNRANPERVVRGLEPIIPRRDAYEPMEVC